MLLLFFFFFKGIIIFVFRKNCDGVLRTHQVKTQSSNGTEKIESVRGRKERKSAKRRRKRRRKERKRENVKGRRSVRGSETENGSEIVTGTGGHDGATPTAATPAVHRTRNGAGPATAGAPESGTESGSAAGMSDFAF